MDFNEKTIFWCFLGFILVESLWELYLDLRQKKVEKKNTEIPNELIGILSRETFDKARLYAIDKSNFSMVKEAFSVAFSLIFLSCDGLFLMWQFSGWYIKFFGYDPTESNEMVQSVAFLFVLNIMGTLVELPLSIYYTFVLEEKHGFNKQTPWFFIKDNLKMFVLQQVLVLPLGCGIIYIVKVGGDYFVVYLWFFVTTVTFLFFTIYPDFIAPLFDKYIPLPAGELRTEIENFAKSLNFPLSDLYVVVGSKRSAHSNAYFYGFFKKKRIVLFDTLLKDFDPNLEGKEHIGDEKKEDQDKKEEKEKKGCDNYEILAVLGHEMGHWKMNHNIKNIIIGELNLLILFVIFAKLFNYVVLYRAFGFHNTTPVLIGFIIILQYIISPYFTLVRYLMAILSRRFEFQADNFAKLHGRANYLKKALIKLNIDNLEFPIYDKWFSAWHNSHPNLLERLQALDKID